MALKCFYTFEIKPTHNSVGFEKMEATSQNLKKAGLASRNKNNRYGHVQSALQYFKSLDLSRLFIPQFLGD